MDIEKKSVPATYPMHVIKLYISQKKKGLYLKFVSIIE